MAAWGFLSRRGYRILERNYRCPLGEIDVVALKNGRLVFVEVKTRSTERFGRPEEAVGFYKRRRLRRVAAWYLKERQSGLSYSFEVLAVLWPKDSEPQFRLIENAISADE